MSDGVNIRIYHINHVKIEGMNEYLVNWVDLSPTPHDRRDIQYLVSGCTATLWCALKPACQNHHFTVNVERIYSFLSGHNFRASQGQSLGGGGRGAGTRAALPHADSTGRWMSLTLLSDHSRDLKQGYSHFPDCASPALLSRGSLHLYLLFSRACSAWATITHALQGSLWIIWPPGVGVTTPAVQSANTAVFKQLRPAGMAVRDPPQDQAVGQGRDNGVSGTLTIRKAGWVCSQSEWWTSLPPDIHLTVSLSV